jgi:hypothetical protein
MALTAKSKWKEELYVLDEQGRSFMFDCGWGVTPWVAYVPPVEQWEASVPVWLYGRRDEVVAAIKADDYPLCQAG